jgi:glucosamine--fructose-6-phosphate aminotransferase (isomerizing)
MCGIIGCVSRTLGKNSDQVGAKVIAGLKRIQYRGYDSFGFAYVGCGNHGEIQLQSYKSTESIDSCDATPDAHVMLGHTRWATHGRVNLTNCHPHLATRNKFALVHNGIVENFQVLKSLLEDSTFMSETDTEVIVRMLEHSLTASESGSQPSGPKASAREFTTTRIKAVKKTVAQLEGRNTIAVIFEDGELIAYRQGSPLVIGINKSEYFLASDALCFAPWTNQCFMVEDGCCVSIAREAVYIENRIGNEVIPKWQSSRLEAEELDMDGYSHYMLKEVMQQWRTIGCQTLNEPGKDLSSEASEASGAIAAVRAAETILVTGAGGAYYTAMQIAWALKEVAGVRAIAVQAYEIESAKCLVKQGDLLIGVSQSGETADTLHAVRMAKAWGLKIVSTINMPMSTLAQESDFTFSNRLGAEVCVLSTKSATAQIVFGYLLAHELAGQGLAARKGLDAVASALAEYLTNSARVSIREVAVQLAQKQHAFLLGREENLGTALIGALNIKEATYLHAEAFAAGELKHGVLALVEEQTPVIIFAPENDDYMVNVAAEVKARGAYVIGISNKDNLLFDKFIRLPAPPALLRQGQHESSCSKALSTVVNIIPCQLLAYELAVLKGINPDRPRNLAKSVTVR